ncbi:hypothetical protein L798_08588 [Zootermopsis nevadensis]|uniref:Uncharacterized protein n=1 Tax=Zootermopsis nevadensis TaxID=136037 RepID=A0A067RA01_ZOONE|nr:hypothetical protein L798_08588 [Zootermopsis nevadensis]
MKGLNPGFIYWDVKQTCITTTTHYIHISGQITIKVSNRQTTFSQLLLYISRPLLHQVIYVWHWSTESKHEFRFNLITSTNIKTWESVYRPTTENKSNKTLFYPY